jgi:hypothetical protein
VIDDLLGLSCTVHDAQKICCKSFECVSKGGGGFLFFNFFGRTLAYYFQVGQGVFLALFR